MEILKKYRDANEVLLTPCQGSIGTGFLNLKLSMGGLANGIP